jgi:predicted O-linked N-acetylglucosamine transferase (SPINDLY family)
MGRLEEALDEYQQAIALKPDQATPRTNAGNVLRRLGRLDEAIRFHRAAMRYDPDRADIRINLANALLGANQIKEAEQAYRDAIRLSPTSSGAVIALFQLLKQIGRNDEARALLDENLERASDPALLALAAHEAYREKRLAEAERFFRRAVKCDPDNPRRLNDLAVVLAEQGQVDAAISTWRQLLRTDPQHATAHLNLGTQYRLLRSHKDAIDHLKRAVELGSEGPLARVSLGHTLVEVGAYGEAESQLRSTFAESPDDVDVQLLAGYLWSAQGRVTESIDASLKAAQLDPSNTAAISNALFASLYSDAHTPEQISALHRRLSRQISDLNNAAFPRTAKRSNDRLRVGYLSPDFRSHPVAFFLEPVLANHDRQRFEIFAYALLPVEDSMTQRLCGQVEHWRRCHGWDDDRLGRQIQEDRIDLLIDLAGHTAHNRAALLCRRPAPVQAVYLGYPCTTGIPGIDYIIGDDQVTPASQAALYSEQLAQVAGYSFLTYQPQPDVPEVSALPAEKAGYVTFGSFNNMSKISPTTVALWAQLLKTVPDARLMLKAQGLGDPATQQQIRARFAEHGISGERLELRGPTVPQSLFMAEYKHVDIGLDPYPYNGGTTTCDALWMGVPVISLAGRHFYSRMGASLLSRLGSSDLVADGEEHYISIAAGLANDIPRLAALRKALRDRVRGSSLGDAEGFTRALEAAYLRIASAQSVSFSQ